MPLLLGIDPLYIIFVFLPSLAIGGLASWMTKSAFRKYSRVGNRNGLSGADAAAEMLKRNGVKNVSIQETGGLLSDHYNPMSRSLNLSRDVYHGRSLAAVGIACHEAGHAIQHAHGFAPLWARTAMVPLTNICSSLYIVPIIIGIFMHFKPLLIVGIVMCGVALVFSVVTLPVEWDASRRAKIAINNAGLLTHDEARHAATVLNAAFLTYVAAVVSALLTLLYWLLRGGLLGGDD